MPIYLFPFYSHPLYVKVIRFMFYCYYPFNSFTSSSLHPSAYVGCWWDLRRDPSFSYLCFILVLGVFQGLCGVWIIIGLWIFSSISCAFFALHCWVRLESPLYTTRFKDSAFFHSFLVILLWSSQNVLDASMAAVVNGLLLPSVRATLLT
jgi:hypothetical protein